MSCKDLFVEFIAVVLEEWRVGVSRYDRSPKCVLPTRGIVDPDICDQIFATRCDHRNGKSLCPLRSKYITSRPKALLDEILLSFDNDMIEIFQCAEIFNGRQEM